LQGNLQSNTPMSCHFLCRYGHTNGNLLLCLPPFRSNKFEPMPPRLPFGQVRNFLLPGQIARRMSSQPSVYVTRPDVDDSGLELLRKRFVRNVAG